MLHLAVLVVTLLSCASYGAERKVFTLSQEPYQGRKLASSVYLLPEDQRTHLDIETVRQSEEFQLNQANNLSFGYTKTYHWLRYTLENPDRRSRSLIVQVDYPLIDTIDFYQPRDDGSYEQQKSGDSQPLENRYLRHHSFTFHVDVPPNSQQTYYMKIGSTSTVTIPLRLWDDTEFVNHMNISSKAQGLYFGCIISILLYNLFLYASTRDKTYGTYVLFLANSMFFYLAWTGVGAEHLWPDSRWLAQRAWPVSGALLAVSIYLFQYHFLGMKNYRKIANFYYFLIALNLSFFVIGFTVELSIAQRVGFFSGFHCGFVSFSIAVYLAVVKKNRQAVFFAIAWTGFLLIIALGGASSLAALDISPTDTAKASQFASAMEAILLSLGLADRINMMKKAQLEQSQKIISGLEKIKTLKQRLEAVLISTKSMTETKDSDSALAAASQSIQSELRSLGIQSILFEEQAKDGSSHIKTLAGDRTQTSKLSVQTKTFTAEKHHVIAPINWKGHNFGTMAVYFNPESQDVQDEDLFFLENTTQSLALALQNIFYQDNLKHLVDERTAELKTALVQVEDRQRKVDDILQNIEQGIFTIDDETNIGDEYSTHLLDIFKVNSTDMKTMQFEDLIFRQTQSTGDQKSLAMESIRAAIGNEDIYWDVNSHHFPEKVVKVFEQDKRHIELEYKPLCKDDHVDQIMVVAKDITDKIKLEEKLQEEEEKKQEFLNILSRLVSLDKHSLNGFFVEGEKIIVLVNDNLSGTFNESAVFRALHTLKGLSRAMKFSQLAEAIHICEGELVSSEHSSQEKATFLRPTFKIVEDTFHSFFQVYNQVFGTEMDDLSSWNLMQFVAEMVHDRIESIRAAGTTLEDIAVRDQVVHWNMEIVSELRNILIHLINNSIDHGYLLPREKNGFTRAIKMSLVAYCEGDDIIITLEDHGFGIDKEKVLQKAKERGLTIEKEHALNVIFDDGFSTSEKATMTSGRGVGLSAVKEKVDGLGGHINVESTLGRGTKFLIQIPKALAVDLDNLLVS